MYVYVYIHMIYFIQAGHCWRFHTVHASRPLQALRANCARRLVCAGFCAPDSSAMFLFHSEHNTDQTPCLCNVARARPTGARRTSHSSPAFPTPTKSDRSRVDAQASRRRPAPTSCGARLFHRILRVADPHNTPQQTLSHTLLGDNST